MYTLFCDGIRDNAYAMFGRCDACDIIEMAYGIAPLLAARTFLCAADEFFVNVIIIQLFGGPQCVL